jgi:RNA polymerase sigma-70 factor, ECF subfamily
MKRPPARSIPLVWRSRVRMTHTDIDIRAQIVALLPRLRNFAFALTGSRDAADEVLQAACEKALVRLDQFMPGTRLDRWMYQIVKTTFIDQVRQTRRRKEADFSPDLTEGLPSEARIHERTEARAALAIIRREIARLPEEQREVLVLVAVDGLSYQAAADIVDVPIGTIMSRLARARRKLAVALEAPHPAAAKQDGAPE